MILKNLSEEEMKNLVINNKLSFQGKTGQKKDVKAYFVLFKGELQIHLKYGKTFYRFKIEEAAPHEKSYFLCHNINLQKPVQNNYSNKEVLSWQNTSGLRY